MNDERMLPVEDQASPEKKQNPHAGHRLRMRRRFAEQGLDGFADHEALELLLCYTNMRGNTNPLAHDLIDRFGSLRGVLEAGVEQLSAVKGVGRETAVLLSLMLPLFRRYQAELLAEKKKISSREEAEDHCLALLSGLRSERFYVICLSADGTVLGHRLIAEGSLNQVPAYPRLIAEAALNHNASLLLFCHNHPGGTPIPSVADRQATAELQAMLSLMGIGVLDHIIVSGSEARSMMAHGDMTQKPRSLLTAAPGRLKGKE